MSIDDFPHLKEFMSAEKDLNFDWSALCLADMQLLDAALRDVRFPIAAERSSPDFESAAAMDRMTAASSRFISALVFVETAVEQLDEARRAIQAASESPASVLDLATQLVSKKVEPAVRGLAAELLARELHQRLRLLVGALDLDAWSGRSELLSASRVEDGSLWLDRVVADLLQSLGPNGSRHAERMLAEARANWCAYSNRIDGLERLRAEQGLWRIWARRPDDKESGHPLVRGLARTLLADVVQPYLKERRKAISPALTLVVAREISSTLLRPGIGLRGYGDVTAVVDADDRQVATVPALGVEELETLERGVEAFAHLTGHRLFRWLVREAHRNVFLGLPNPSFVSVEGGLAHLALNIGARSKAAADELRGILRAGQELRRTWPGGETGGLWTYRIDDRSGPGRHSLIEVRLGHMLMPFYGKRRLDADEQLLVPMVPLPPLVPRERDQAAQAAFQVEIMLALVDQRRTLGKLGGADLPDPALAKLAAAVGLPEATRKRVMVRWLADGDDGPAFLERVGAGVYNLADNDVFGDARRFLLNTARMSSAQSRRALRRCVPKRSPRSP